MKKHWDTRGRTGAISKNGYRVFCRGKRSEAKRKYAHRMVWEKYFGPIPAGCVIHHKDGNKLNNDIKNLQLMPKPQHAREHALSNKLGKDRIGIPPTNKTDIKIIKRIKKLRKQGMYLKDIMVETGLSYATVQKYAKKD